MENVIDVAFREVVDLSEMSTEQLTEQANTIYRQAESIAAVSLQLVAEAGRRLIIIKNRIGHGGWEEWMEKNLTFSGRKANRMMKLAEKMEDEGSIFANPTTLSDIGISKVWALLEAPEEVAAEVVSGRDAESMTVKELKAEIEKIKSERAAIAALSKDDQAEISELREKVERQAGVIRKLEKDIEEAGSSEEAERELETVKQNLEAMRANLENTKQKLVREKEKARSAAEEAKRKALLEANRIIDEAKADAEKAASEAEKRIRHEEAGIRAELEAENQKLKKMADPVMTEFKVKVDMLQQAFVSCLQPIASAPEERTERMRNALKTVMRRMEEQI